MWSNSRQQDDTWRVLWWFLRAFFVVVQLLSCVQLFVTPWIPAACQVPCPSPSPSVCSNSRPLSRWCHRTLSLFFRKQPFGTSVFYFFPPSICYLKSNLGPRGFCETELSSRPWITYLWDFMWKRTTFLSCLSCCYIKFIHYSCLSSYSRVLILLGRKWCGMWCMWKALVDVYRCKDWKTPLRIL